MVIGGLHFGHVGGKKTIEVPCIKNRILFPKDVNFIVLTLPNMATVQTSNSYLTPISHKILYQNVQVKIIFLILKQVVMSIFYCQSCSLELPPQIAITTQQSLIILPFEQSFLESKAVIPCKYSLQRRSP